MHVSFSLVKMIKWKLSNYKLLTYLSQILVNNSLNLCHDSDQTFFSIHRGSYMSAHILLNVLIKIGEKR